MSRHTFVWYQADLMPPFSAGGVVWRIRASDTRLVCAAGSRNGTEETKLLVLDFDLDDNKTESDWGRRHELKTRGNRPHRLRSDQSPGGSQLFRQTGLNVAAQRREVPKSYSAPSETLSRRWRTDFNAAEPMSDRATRTKWRRLETTHVCSLHQEARLFCPFVSALFQGCYCHVL